MLPSWNKDIIIIIIIIMSMNSIARPISRIEEVLEGSSEVRDR